MLRTRLARTWVLLLCLCCVASARSATSADIAQSHVLHASLNRTAMLAEFDAASVTNATVAARNILELPYGGALLMIAPTGTPTARVVNVVLGETVHTALDATGLPTTIEQIVTLDEPVILHGTRLVGVSIAPLTATPEGVRIVTSVEYEVTTSGAGGVNAVAYPQPVHWAFEPILRRTVDNLDALDPLVSLDAPARYLVIISTPLFNTHLQANAQFNAWLDLKRRKGFQLQVTTLAQIAAAQGDSSENSIRNYVQSTYEDASLAPLVYAVFIGDESGTFSVPTKRVPNPEIGGDLPSVGDGYFFAVDGDDYIPDVLNGRISGQSPAEYVSYFRKVAIYETNPYTENLDWFSSITCTAGNYAEGGLFPVTPVWNMNWAREYVMNAGCITDADTFYYHDNTDDPLEYTEEIIDDINQGVCAVWYRGWAASPGWQYPVLFNSDIEAGVNVGTKFPAVWGIVCGSGNFGFTSGPCFGETWITGLGTATDPDGAIVFLGASDLHTNTRHNNAMLAAMAEGMIVDGNRSTGGLALAGKLEVYRQYPLERPAGGLVEFYGFHVFNILGDPEVPLYFCLPHDLDVQVPQVLSRGQTWVDVHVTDGNTGQPVPRAIVGIRPGAGERSWTAVTDGSGNCAVPVNLTGTTTAQLTVWKHTYFMEMADVAVGPSDAADPMVAEPVFTAGDDGLPNPGENVQMTFGVRNVGSQAATWSISAVALDTNVTITNGNSTLPALAPGELGTSSAISATINDNAWGGAVPVLRLTLNDGQNSLIRDVRFTVAAVDPQILSIDVQDADGILSPGETANIFMDIRNLGLAGASEVTATVHSWDNAISFSDNTLNWTNVGVGQDVVSASSFTATLPGNVTPGRQIALRVVFSVNGAPITWRQFVFTVGTVTPNVPTGPDEYGYYAYEDIDGGFTATPSFAWTELDPDSGGSGATQHLVRDDSYVGVPLPQDFSFYGAAYDSIYVCSNGWISFGRATLPEFRNWEIPSPIGPPAMICAFWDDLIANTDSIYPNDNAQHEIFTRTDGNRFIVQWRTLNRAGLNSGGTPNRDYCAFQCVLEYPAAGDGSVLLLYKQIANTDQTNNYASVGIQDAQHLRGLGLTFANTYLPSVAPLAALRAIRFTTTPPDPFLGSEDPRELPTAFALHAAYPNPFNPATELRFDLARNGATTLRVFDTLGREVATLIDRDMQAGTHSVRFDGANLASGVYFARLTSGANTAVQKVVLMK